MSSDSEFTLVQALSTAADVPDPYLSKIWWWGGSSERILPTSALAAIIVVFFGVWPAARAA